MTDEIRPGRRPRWPDPEEQTKEWDAYQEARQQRGGFADRLQAAGASPEAAGKIAGIAWDPKVDTAAKALFTEETE